MLSDECRDARVLGKIPGSLRNRCMNTACRGLREATLAKVIGTTNLEAILDDLDSLLPWFKWMIKSLKKTDGAPTTVENFYC